MELIRDLTVQLYGFPRTCTEGHIPFWLCHWDLSLPAATIFITWQEITSLSIPWAPPRV